MKLRGKCASHTAAKRCYKMESEWCQSYDVKAYSIMLRNVKKGEDEKYAWTYKIYVHDHACLIYLVDVRDSHKRECRVEATTRYEKSMA